MGSFLTLLLIVIMLASVFGEKLWGRSSRHERAKQLASQLGLQVTGNDELTGDYKGHSVSQYSKDHGGSGSTEWWTYTRCHFAFELPDGLSVANQGLLGGLADALGLFQDLQVGNALDPLLTIGARDPEEARDVLTDPAVVRCLLAAVDGGRLELSSSRLTLSWRGDHLDRAERYLDEVTELAEALRRASRGGWDAVAERFGLSIDADATRLDGTVDGVAISVELQTKPARRTRILAPVKPQLPDGSHLIHHERGQGRDRLGDPILDDLLAVETSDAQALASRVCTDAVRGPLLEVVHGHPGSTVTDTAIGLVAPGRVGRALEAKLRLVVELAKALES